MLKYIGRKFRNLSIKYYSFRVIGSVMFLYGKNISIKMPSHFGKGSFIQISSNVTDNFLLKIGKGFTARKRVSLKISSGGRLIISENVFMNDGCSINCQHSVYIGKDCLFGNEVSIFDQNHKFNLKGVPIRNQGYSYAEVKIGENCWLGRGVTILKGVEIGNHCVIGAHCLISNNIPDYTLVKLVNGVLVMEKIQFKI